MTEPDRPLTDEQVHERLCAAVEALGAGEPATVRGRTTMETARRALVLLQFGIIAAMEAGTDTVQGVQRPED